MWFERDRAKDHEDTAKNQQCVKIMRSRKLIKCHSSQTKRSAESTENWCVDGLINFEEPFSGLEELSFNPVSYSAKTNYV